MNNSNPILKHFFRYLSLSVGVLSLHAQDTIQPTKTDRPAQAEKAGRPDRESMIKKVDTDGDGKLSLEEFSAAPRLESADAEKVEKIFTHLDKNNDGMLEDSELPCKEEREEHFKKHKERMERVDTDQDGKISKEEFLTNPPPRLSGGDPSRIDELFGKMDMNQDGFLSREDRKMMEEKRPHGQRPFGKPKGDQSRPHHKPGKNPFLKNDADGDGKISFDEFGSGGRAPEMTEEKKREVFDKLDSNGDGYLDAADRKNRPFREGRD